MSSRGSNPGCGSRVAPPLSVKPKLRPAEWSQPSHTDVSEHRRCDGPSEMTCREEEQPDKSITGRVMAPEEPRHRYRVAPWIVAKCSQSIVAEVQIEQSSDPLEFSLVDEEYWQ
ncbi:hypothetical protein DUI87_32790 [Hirundo rustica rustica]|uniref:Uncharacterized protein n=1 Tax=Hirundo rustica rustica TaxID=333673 RepID=A0A3M0IPE5_HIRRU|nr:hypothetical protein DUI87_32790 [Hirundo rustica rustica]